MSARSTRFGEQLNNRFITKYTEFTHLYDKNHPLHRNAHARKSAYDELRKLVDRPDFSITDVRNKIRIFRSTYSQELQKLLKGKYKHYRPSLHWFDIMDKALRNHVTVKSENSAGVSNYDPLSLTHFEEFGSEYKRSDLKRPIVYEEAFVDETSNSGMPHDDDIDDAEVVKEEEVSETFVDIIQRQASVPKMTRLSQESDNGEDSEIRVRQKGTGTDLVENSDEFEIFGKGVAIQLRQLPLDVALNTQLRIQSLLINARLGRSNTANKMNAQKRGT